MKKKDGARSGNCAVKWRRRLPSISTTVTSSASPSPSDRITDGVIAPGREILANASRSMVARGRGKRATPAITESRHQPQQDEGGGRRGDEDHRNLAVDRRARSRSRAEA